MKTKLLLLLLTLITFSLKTQTSLQMERKVVNTKIGQIAVFQKQVDFYKTPIIFLHGVYFDHHLWENQITAISDRPVFALDMPLHGESKVNIKEKWNLDDCAEMLLEILDSLKIDKVIAIGHSWGSMTILRAAHKNPTKFAGVGLGNMPYKEATKTQKIIIRLQQSGLMFKNFYIKQAGIALMGKESRNKNHELMQKLITPMIKLSKKEIKYTNKAVRIDARDATEMINKLKVPVIAFVGKDDYVGTPPVKETTIVNGGHVSPIEVPEEVNIIIGKLTTLVD